jgi:hypothetical protein
VLDLLLTNAQERKLFLGALLYAIPAEEDEDCVEIYLSVEMLLRGTTAL